MKIYLRIFNYARKLNSRLVWFFLFSLLSVGFSAIYLGLLMPILSVLFNNDVPAPTPLPEFTLSGDYFSALFNHFLAEFVKDQGRAGALLFVCISIVFFMTVANLFRYLERIMATMIKVDIVKNLRMAIFEKISALHIGYFNDQRKGDLLSRFTNDMGEVENSVVNALKSVLKEPVVLIVYIVVLFSISVKLSLFTLVVLPLTGAVIGELIRRLRRKARQSQESVGRIVNILEETLSGMRVITAFNARNFVVGKLDQETSYHRKVNLSIARKNELASPLSEVLGVVVVAFILYFGGREVLEGSSRLEPQEFIGFIVFYVSMIQPAKNFANGITSLQKGTSAANRIFGVVDMVPLIQDTPASKAVSGFADSLEFRNVSFAYDQQPVLRNISFKVNKGETVALVGPSGGGKSTLMDLIPRFYDPKEGTIFLDGTPLPELKAESVRGLMGVVTQESILFNDTVFNNIAFGLTHSTLEDVQRAARVANAHDFIMQMENGYDTVIGERGGKLSGGQRQRLSIARAVLRNPPILLLDEATSALDTESERLVQEALTSLMKDRTSIVIAHRLSTITHATKILVIQEGTIVEAGKHAELMQLDGLYRRLIEMQGMASAT